MTEQIMSIDRMEHVISVFGSFDENLRIIEDEMEVRVTDRDSELKISGDAENVMQAQRAIEGLVALAAKGENIDAQNVRYIISLVRSGQDGKIGELARDVICVTAKGKPIKAKTLGQKRYVDAIAQNTVTLGIGPAGTGKTYLAVAAAVAAFRSKTVNRIILTRPAVEAGERLGFLPGDLQSKVDPYLRPLYDALFDMLGAETYNKNTCKVWSNFLGILKRFYAENPFTWTDVNKSLTDRFVCFMEDEGYMVKSINKYLICFRAMVGYALEQGMHENTFALKAFSKKKVQESDKAKEIYLTGTELQALYEMKLDGLKGKIRDVFLVGTYLCQRFSDYSRLERENFTTTAKGTKIVRIVQEKTGNSVVIPILNDNLLHIAEKYDYEIPKVNDVVLNRYIKQILKELSETVPTLARLERTVLTMKERTKEERGEVSFTRDTKGHVVKPRYDLVSSHTARRSGITNLYLTGLFDSFQMMSVSGHKDEKTFNEYIKLSSDEIADTIARKVEDREKKEVSNEGLF